LYFVDSSMRVLIRALSKPSDTNTFRASVWVANNPDTRCIVRLLSRTRF